MPDQPPVKLLDARQRIGQLASERDSLSSKLAELDATLARERQVLVERAAVGDAAGVTHQQATVDDLLAQRRAIGTQSVQLTASIRDVIGAAIDDEFAVEADVPIALLPLRIETRYSPDGTQLRVRIYPDAVHLEALDEGVSDAERSAGIAYWTAVWTTGDASQAWPILVAATSVQRAPWVAHTLTPVNIARRPVEAPVFPDTSPIRQQPTMVRTLPDRFQVSVEQTGAPPVVVPGVAIPAELPVTLPHTDDLIPVVGVDGLPLVDEATRWTVDYAAAEAIGMAVTVTLAHPGQAIDRLLVLGLRASLDPTAAAAALGRLLVAHRYSDGAEFVPQATPSNNTESDRAAWSRRAPPSPPPATPPSLASGSNAAVLATALGVDASIPGSFPFALDIEQPRAQAMAVALWESTWGQMLERLLQPFAMSDATRTDAREHAVSWVRGRGPLPALRLAREPYGVLPVMPIDAAVFRPVAGAFEAKLAPFLEILRPLWTTGATSLPTIMQGNLETVLPEILGQSPVLQGLLVRKVTARNKSMEPAVGLVGVGDNDAAQQEVNQVANLLLSVEPSRLKSNGTLGQAANRLTLPLANKDDQPFIKALLDDQPAPTPTSVLQVLLGHAAGLELHKRTSIAAGEDLDRVRVVLDQAPDDIRGVAEPALAAIAAGTPASREVQVAADTFDRAGLRIDRDLMAAREPLPGLATGTLFQRMTRSGQLLVALDRNQSGLQLLGEIFAAARRQAEFREALQTLIGVDSDDERALLLAETLDVASHRLDAWITSLATARLASLRAARGGTLIGAYGWVENITPEPPPAPVAALDGVPAPVFESARDGGFIHAPSLTHATTAAVLRSGRLTHQPEDANSGALNIDLSSGRVRQGIEIIDGMRNGQPLGALLGYRLERALHDNSGPQSGLELDRYIYVLRALAPLIAGKHTDRNAPQEVVAATSVVDGVRLTDLEELDPNAIDTALRNGPKELGSQTGRYVLTWVPPSATELNAVHAAIRETRALHDAVADLLLAEGVHQLVQGNTGRAAAALDAMAAGEAIPPIPDVIRTPMSGTAITHRVMVACPLPAPAPVAGWDITQPRAIAEPTLETWVEVQLGSPEPSMVAAGLCALDFLYDADGDSFTMTSLALRLPQNPSERLWQLARSLRALVVKARPLSPDVLGRTVQPNEMSDRAKAAQSALASAVVALAGVDDLDVTLKTLLPFGIRIGPSTGGLDPTNRQALAKVLIAEADRRAKAASALLAEGRTADAFAAIFGDGFLALPRVLPVAQVDPDGKPSPLSEGFAAALGPNGVRAADGGEIRPWLARAASVQPAIARYAETILFRESSGTRCRLGIAQTPVGSPTRWLGLPFPEDEALPVQPMTAMVIEAGFGTPLTGAEELAGFIVDEWIDVAPRRIPIKRADDPSKFDNMTRATTGVAINANGPGARPPQAILLAVSSDGQTWSRDKLLHTVTDTLELARIRAVTLERVPWAARILPALYFQDWSLQGEPIILWDKLTQVSVFRAQV